MLNINSHKFNFQNNFHFIFPSATEDWFDELLFGLSTFQGSDVKRGLGPTIRVGVSSWVGPDN